MTTVYAQTERLTESWDYGTKVIIYFLYGDTIHHNVVISSQ